jgi:hypothetical protein
LYCSKEEKRSLRILQKGTILFLEIRFPTKSTDSGKASKSFDEVSIEGCFCFQVEESNLARGAEVEALDEPEGEEEERKDRDDVGAADTD